MITAIILAGGKGKRVGASKSKQYIELNKKPMLYYTLKKFIDNNLIDKIALVLSYDEIEYCKSEVLDKYKLKVDNIIIGGDERQESVYNGLKSIEKTDIVLIHDAARPFVSQKIINEAIKYAKLYKASAPGIMPKDTIKVKDEANYSVETLERSTLVAVQTPQAFDYNMIYNCHNKIKQLGIRATDDTMVVESCGNKVYIFEGDYTNIKITTPEDLILAEYLVKA